MTTTFIITSRLPRARYSSPAVAVAAVAHHPELFGWDLPFGFWNDEPGDWRFLSPVMT
jgi:hypothetical protein